MGRRKPGLTRDSILNLVGHTAFERGQVYVQEGRVLDMEDWRGTLLATVRGQEDYRVRMRIQGRGADPTCTCPAAEREGTCKHIAAAGLAWLERQEGGLPSGEADSSDAPVKRVHAYLSGLEKSALIDLLLQRALEDEAWLDQLKLEASRQIDGPDRQLAALCQALDRAIDGREFVPYGEAGGYAAGIGRVVQSATRMLQDGGAAQALAFAEYALDRANSAMESVDDSDGQVGGVLQSVHDLHLQACRVVKPDPECLAERLLEWILGCEYGESPNPDDYAGVLGEQGMAHLRRLVEDKWSHLPPLRKGSHEDRFEGHRTMLSVLMERWARESGDVDALAAVMSRDLSTPYVYLRIAGEFLRAGRLADAKTWVERGIAGFPLPPDSRLREFLVQVHHAQGDAAAALEQAWLIFSEQPSADHYKTLRRSAKKTGRWPEQRERALALVREMASHKLAKSPAWDRYSHANAVLVEIFLDEKDVDAAWREANTGGCGDQLWERLADALTPARPKDALAAYRRLLDRALRGANPLSYAQAVRMLRGMQQCHLNLGEPQAFLALVGQLRDSYRRRRLFVAALDAAGWKG